MSRNLSTPLFRPAMLSSVSQQSLGGVRLAQPTSAWLISGFAIIISAAFLIFICNGSVSKKAHVTGLLMPRNGTLGITSPNTGVLLRNYVSEGQNVKKGQTLFELSTERKGNSGELSFLVEQQLANRAHSLDTEQRLRITQYEEKKAALVQRLLNLKAENDQLDHEIELAQRRVSLAQQSQSKFETLEASGYVSAAQTQQKQEE